MAEQNTPNDASRKTKAEGERWDEGDMADANQPGGGITNRPVEEERENQEAVPERGESQYGAHAGHGPDPNRSER